MSDDHDPRILPAKPRHIYNPHMRRRSPNRENPSPRRLRHGEVDYHFAGIAWGCLASSPRTVAGLSVAVLLLRTRGATNRTGSTPCTQLRYRRDRAVKVTRRSGQVPHSIVHAHAPPQLGNSPRKRFSQAPRVGQNSSAHRSRGEHRGAQASRILPTQYTSAREARSTLEPRRGNQSKNSRSGTQPQISIALRPARRVVPRLESANKCNAMQYSFFAFSTRALLVSRSPPTP